MIPAKLKLSNFTSYGEIVPELDFSKLHLAAISGSNGAGKSSLILGLSHLDLLEENAKEKIKEIQIASHSSSGNREIPNHLQDDLLL